MNKKLVIAVDGYSSCGKSTVARELAHKLGYIYIDSGAMYRAATLFCMENNLLGDEQKIISRLNEINIEFRLNPVNGNADTWLNEVNVENRIRKIDVSDNVSQVSRIKNVREKMVAIQRKLGEKKGIVMDGRDIGTVVFPDADLKIFMTASPEIRAQRRFDELVAKGDNISLDEIISNIKKRDQMDENRTESPLRKADDAVVLDNGNMTRNEQMEWIMNLVASKIQ
ncbi:MAG: cytidylate kinase [Bacteroidetes bacterium GWF2_38_335]|nr:MAG: cytidylate kinase [Bacteroidetes bacterium GWF2_38_335]OFY81631.1 MAG: cytidylate kinase [Bacteroidetes bacterium RIFOXYA12_FULL_38_20]HBS88983.1 (d)CMP kinase [Bacteroidales bacterium]